MPNLLLQHEAVLMRLQLIVDHLMDLLLQEGGLLVVEGALLLELSAQGVLRDLEVVLHHHERVLQDILQYLHLLLDAHQLLFRLCVQTSR
jgi:hypothetical protein